MPPPHELEKYWNQRYRLFSRFDEGIELDEEGWYSVTPERIAAHIAQRFQGLDVVVDLFSGPGGNSIQFALHGAHVIGVEQCAETIAMARNNARVYGVEQYIDFVQADVYEVLPRLGELAGAVDGIFMSPPWGGPRYNCGGFDVGVFREAVDGALKITSNVSVLIPRNVTLSNVAETFGTCEVEKNFLGHKYKTQTLYFGDLMGDTEGMEMKTFAPRKKNVRQSDVLMDAEVLARLRRSKISAEASNEGATESSNVSSSSSDGMEPSKQ